MDSDIDPRTREAEIDELLGVTEPSAEEKASMSPSEELHQKLMMLRGRLLMAADRLRSDSALYYYLCDLMSGRQPCLQVSLAFNVPGTPEEQPSSTPFSLSLLDDTGSPNELVRHMLSEASRAYAFGWSVIREVSQAAELVCQELASCALVEESASKETPT